MCIPVVLYNRVRVLRVTDIVDSGVFCCIVDLVMGTCAGVVGTFVCDIEFKLSMSTIMKRKLSRAEAFRIWTDMFFDRPFCWVIKGGSVFLSMVLLFAITFWRVELSSFWHKVFDMIADIVFVVSLSVRLNLCLFLN